MAQKSKTSTAHKILTVVGIILCVILIPLLIVNVTLIVKSYTNPDEVPSVGGAIPYIVYTDSMSGTFESGDLIICKEVEAKDVKVKDVITFVDPAGNGTSLVTHRVIEVIKNENGTLSFRTKGDANNAEDDYPVPEDKLVARYEGFCIAGLGSVALFMQTTPGLIVCVILPLVLLIGYDVVRRKISDKSNKQDTDALLAELEALRAAKAEAETSKSEPVEAPAEAPAEVETANEE